MKQYKFTVPLFDVEIIFYHGSFSEFSDVAKSVNLPIDAESYYGLAFSISGATALGVYIDSEVEPAQKRNIVYHESLHLCNIITESVGVFQSQEHDELTALLQTNIASKMIELLEKEAISQSKKRGKVDANHRASGRRSGRGKKTRGKIRG